MIKPWRWCLRCHWYRRCLQSHWYHLCHLCCVRARFVVLPLTFLPQMNLPTFQGIIQGFQELQAATNQAQAGTFPSVCSLVKTPHFRKCLSLHMSPSVCGTPPKPCVHFKYRVPLYFIEVTGVKETFFKELPLAQAQIRLVQEALPIVTEDDGGTFSYHGRTINVPLASLVFKALPCGEASRPSPLCFSAMSEHLGRLWKTGEADLWQPSFLAWSASPKACLLKGAVSGMKGMASMVNPPSLDKSQLRSTPKSSSQLGACSFDHSFMKRFPPSRAPICTGWGIHFPRSSTVETTDPTTASLVIASRIKSLGEEVFQSVSSDKNEVWQMIYPQSSSCFREGQNIGQLRFKGVSEWGRLVSGRMKNYLYVIWKPRRCTRSSPWVATTKAWLAALEGACHSLDPQ